VIIMLTSKQVADIITWSRTLLVPLFIWLGLAYGPEALPAVTLLMVLNLTADSIDGPLARRSPDSPQTWIGENDLAIDMFVNAGVMGYLTLAGFIPWQATGLYVLFWALIFWWRGGAFALGIIFQVPIYATFIYILLRDAAPYFLLFVGWIVAAIIVSWPKFPRVIVPGFLNGVRDMIRRRRHPRDIS
jgi:phosphatidylglycerophosphate synthase